MPCPYTEKPTGHTLLSPRRRQEVTRLKIQNPKLPLIWGLSVKHARILAYALRSPHSPARATPRSHIPHGLLPGPGEESPEALDLWQSLEHSSSERSSSQGMLQQQSRPQHPHAALSTKLPISGVMPEIW